MVGTTKYRLGSLVWVGLEVDEPESCLERKKRKRERRRKIAGKSGPLSKLS